MCVCCQSPSGFVWLIWCVQFLIWCFLVTFPIQGQSPNKDWHMLMEGGVGREMVLLCPLFELESCPCKITPAGVWKRESFCIFLKCYCHSAQRNISHFKLEKHDCSLCVTLVPQTGGGAGAHAQEENQWQANVSRDCFHDLSSRMSRVRGPTPSPGALLHHPHCWKTGHYTSSEPPFLWFKDYYFFSNPSKTPLWILYTCCSAECLNFWENTEENQLTPHKVTQRPFWLSRDLTGRQKTPLLPYQDRFKAPRSVLTDST